MNIGDVLKRVKMQKVKSYSVSKSVPIYRRTRGNNSSAELLSWINSQTARKWFLTFYDFYAKC